ncbi:head maturation protease, ClpP-related [Defluviimonas sp. SAOS-178_SWC]|uniref:head maturation protease, ClpP-related n=1 Tax=Defluviimonas sp. SAOS-178_SWC TaxID=3121287 RepID=UPI003221D1F2
MSQRNLPELSPRKLPQTCAFMPDSSAIDRWNGGIAAQQTPDNTISILDVIGEDFWTGGGVTSKRVAAALRSIGEGTDVFVDINSPGGDFFEGVAIYNLLREHKAKVTVRVLGIAASAASVVAMAGDEIMIGKAGFLMVHNAWVVAIGNRHDLTEAAKTMEPFDDAMATVYSDRAGVTKKAAARWMDDETWFNGEQAVENGLADGFLASDATKKDPAKAKALAEMKPALKAEFAMRRAGMSRNESRSLIGDLVGEEAVAAALQRQAVADDDDLRAALQQLTQTLSF